MQFDMFLLSLVQTILNISFSGHYKPLNWSHLDPVHDKQSGMNLQLDMTFI